MKIYFLLFMIICVNCSKPLYIKNRHFNPIKKKYKINTDLKELVHISLERAFVTEKDIPDYRLLWKKHQIYVSNEYQNSKTDFKNQKYWDKTISYLKTNEVPNYIGNVMFSLKSREELQKISDKTLKNFLHASFSLIKIEGNTATVKIDNSWIVSKHSKKIYLSGGGYTCIYKKINGVWKFQKIISSWIS